MRTEKADQYKTYYIHLAWKPVTEALKSVSEHEFDSGEDKGLTAQTFVAVETGIYFIRYDPVHYDLRFVWDMIYAYHRYIKHPS
jgi:hypothetical protein